MPTGNKPKFGIIFGRELALFTHKCELLASDVLSAKSGRYLVYDQSDTYFRAVNDGEAAISAYTDWSGTANATSGKTKVEAAFNVDMFVCELPFAAAGAASTLTAALLKTYLGNSYDIYVTGNIQYADVQTTDTIIRVVGGSVQNNSLYTIANNADIGSQIS